MAGKSASRSSSSRTTSKIVIGRSSSSHKPKDSRRKLLVFSALAASLSVTALFLQLLSPPPARAQVHSTVLMGEPIERISSRIDGQAARSWKYIFIHQSKTTYADKRWADEVGDHFVIGNGAGVGDGDLKLSDRWGAQQTATAPQGASSIDADCISICLVGDLDRTKPTATQMRRLSELVSSLRSKYGIPANRVFTSSESSPAGIGKNFPANDFGRQLRSNQ